MTSAEIAELEAFVKTGSVEQAARRGSWDDSSNAISYQDGLVCFSIHVGSDDNDFCDFDQQEYFFTPDDFLVIARELTRSGTYQFKCNGAYVGCHYRSEKGSYTDVDRWAGIAQLEGEFRIVGGKLSIHDVRNVNAKQVIELHG